MMFLSYPNAKGRWSSERVCSILSASAYALAAEEALAGQQPFAQLHLTGGRRLVAAQQPGWWVHRRTVLTNVTTEKKYREPLRPL